MYRNQINGIVQIHSCQEASLIDYARNLIHLSLVRRGGIRATYTSTYFAKIFVNEFRILNEEIDIRVDCLVALLGYDLQFGRLFLDGLKPLG